MGTILNGRLDVFRTIVAALAKHNDLQLGAGRIDGFQDALGAGAGAVTRLGTFWRFHLFFCIRDHPLSPCARRAPFMPKQSSFLSEPKLVSSRLGVPIPHINHENIRKPRKS
jgi:hypothetical protein